MIIHRYTSGFEKSIRSLLFTGNQAYKQYASVTASLHNGVYDSNITNYYHAGIEHTEYKYNFYSEAANSLKVINYSAALNTFLYGAFVNMLDQVSVSSDPILPNFMSSAINYLKDNDGHRDSSTYCYVAHGNVSLKKMKIYSDVTFRSKDKFDGHVYSNIAQKSHYNDLGQNRYVNTDMINTMYKRWESLGSPQSSFSQYLSKCTGLNIGTYLMTKFDGEGDFSEGDGMYLKTCKHNIMTGNSGYRIMPSNSWFTISSSFSAIKTYSESFSSNIKSHFTYNGEVLNLGTMTPVKVGGKNNCLYAFASLTDHRTHFVFDEATVFSSYGYYDNDTFDYSYNTPYEGGKRYWRITYLDYLCLS